MAINFQDVTNRWENIRKNPECDLELSPETVALFMSEQESELVRGNIRNTLEHLADFRLESGDFVNDSPTGSGSLVRCEGLETFLVPAVEGVLSFSSFLKNMIQ